MKRLVLNREQSRLVDQIAIERYGMSGLVLMENAGRGAVEVLMNVGLVGPAIICCGRGNNGGDGFVMARHLNNWGMPLKVLLFADQMRLAGDAAANFAIIQKSGLPIAVLPAPTPEQLDAALADAGCIVDALLGTGAQGEPRAPYDLVIDAVNRQSAPVLAVDVPSGLDCDTGIAAKHTIRATHTVTFVAKKQGFQVREAEPYVGWLHEVDIGVPRKLIDEIAGESDAN